MNGDADAYHEAANERLVDAFMLYQMRRYVLSLYSSGVAVECMFRAHRLRFDPVFDSRHDLHELCKASKIKQELSVDQAKRLAEALTALARLWRNDYRFELERVVRRLLKRGKHDRAARTAYNAADIIIRIGTTRWTS